MRVVHLFLFALLVLSRWAVAQPGASAATVADSLRRVLATAPPDTNRLHLLQVLCETLTDNPAAQMPLATEGLKLADRLHHRHYQCGFVSLLGSLNVGFQDYVAATRYYQTLLRLAEPPPVNALMMMRAHLGLGDVAGAEDDFVEACHQFRLAVHWAEALPTTDRRRLHRLTVTYTALLKAYAFRLQPPGSTARPPDSLLAQTHYHIRQSLRLAQRLRHLGDEKSYRGNLASVWESLADLHHIEGHLDSAIYYKQRAISTFQEIGAMMPALAQQQHLINLEIEAGHYAQAAALARQTQQLAHEGGQPVLEADAMSSLASALASGGSWREAYQVLNRSITLRDTALSADKREALAELQVRFDTERKESRIRELTQREQLERALADRRRQQVWGLTAGLVVVLLAAAAGSVLFERLRRSRAALAALTESKDRLYALVAHDLRSPMQALVGVPPMISHYVKRQDLVGLAELPSLVAGALGQLSQLLDNLLHWAAAQTGELTSHPAAQPLHVLFEECAALYAATAANNRVSLHFTPPAANATLWADPQMVRTVLRNLVGNALKFTPPGGSVTVGAEATPTGTALLVTDTGPGLTAAQAAALLGPQSTLNGSLRQAGARGEGGTGLGLRLCLLFVQRHGGTLELLGQPGVGTTARAWFPAAG